MAKAPARHAAVAALAPAGDEAAVAHGGAVAASDVGVAAVASAAFALGMSPGVGLDRFWSRGRERPPHNFAKA